MIVLLSHPLSRDFLTLQGAEDLSRINSSPAGLAEGGGGGERYTTYNCKNNMYNITKSTLWTEL